MSSKETEWEKNQKKFQETYLRFIEQTMSLSEEEKAEKEKYMRNPKKHQMRHHLELMLTAEQLLKIGSLLLQFDDKSNVNGQGKI